jgi:hypothetical protein
MKKVIETAFTGPYEKIKGSARVRSLPFLGIEKELQPLFVLEWESDAGSPWSSSLSNRTNLRSR